MKKNIYKSTKTLFFVLCGLVFVFGIFSCATTKAPKTPILTKYDDMFFWEIQGADTHGKLSTIYVLGTIHVGDERLYPLPEEIAKAYGSADRVYGEVSTEDWKLLVPRLSSKINQSLTEAKQIEMERGFAWYDTLTSEQQQFLENKLGKAVVDSQKSNMPWVMNNFISDLSLKGTGLNANYAYDTHFITVSNNYEIPMYGLDKLDVQIDILTYGDIDFQVENLASTIDEFLKDEQAVYQDTITLYETYLTGNEDALEKCLFSETKKEIEDNPKMQGYYNALFLDRNTNWAETFAQLIAEGGTTFVFAGSGHFIGEDSVFNIMKQNGDLSF